MVCPACGANNRIKDPPQGQVPVCGACKAPLPWVVEVGSRGLTPELQAPVPVLVDFWAEWCAPCRAIAPILEELAREYAGKLKVVRLNVDLHPLPASAYHVRSIPTLILFKDGVPVDSWVGAMPKATLKSYLEPHLQAPRAQA